MKTCSKCDKLKAKECFSRDAKRKDGLQPQCKACFKEYRQSNSKILKVKKADYYAKNRARISSQKKEWRLNNLEKIKEYNKVNALEIKKAKQKWALNNKEHLRKVKTKYHLTKYRSDIEYRIKHNLRSNLYNKLKNSKNSSVTKCLGCSVTQLKAHLEAQFQPGMNWDNYGRDGWHIDHIRPLASFNLKNKEEFKKACHYTNLQPLWAEDNLRKGAKHGHF